MSEYSHILFATDFSPASDHAGRRAVEIARRYDARLTLLHVIEHFPEDLPINPIGPEDVDPQIYLTEKSRADLDAQAQRIGADGAKRMVVFSARSTKHAIIEAVKDAQVDLLIMGANHRHGLPPLGSLIGGIIHHVTCDVLAVHMP